MKIPEESGFSCQARLHGKKKIYLAEVYWEGTIRHDEITGEIYWSGPPLSPGDTLRLCEGDDEIGIVRVLGETSE